MYLANLRLPRGAGAVAVLCEIHTFVFKLILEIEGDFGHRPLSGCGSLESGTVAVAPGNKSGRKIGPATMFDHNRLVHDEERRQNPRSKKGNGHRTCELLDSGPPTFASGPLR